MCFHEFKDHGNIFDSWAKAYHPVNTSGSIEIAICEITKISKWYAFSFFAEESVDEIWRRLELRTIAKIKARIDFELFEFGKEYEEIISRDHTQNRTLQKTSLTDCKIELDILSALKRIRMNNPRKYEYDCLEIAGYAYIYQIDFNRIEFLVSVLIEKEFVQHNKIEQTGIPEGGFYITALGLANLQKLQQDTEAGMNIKNESDILQHQANIYDIALSFAGEEREYVSYVADRIKQAGFKIFYDKYEEVDLWGQDLYQRLYEVYSKRSRYCVVFVSANYANKVWPKHELRSAQERALREARHAYILPVRFDDTELPGLPNTIHYFDARTKKQDELVEFILKKLTTTE